MSHLDQRNSDAMANVLAALEILDTSITGTCSITDDKSAYLTSPTLIKRWQVELNAQLSMFLEGKCTSEAFESRLQLILVDVEKLERMRDLIPREASDGKAWEVVNGRCREIEVLFEGLEKRLSM
ncbi:hypothetical protein IFR05_009287 [Cadophora sp. M221]|nr:hypothetical protein IFR05_009287 [Cadophora sp. M221]